MGQKDVILIMGIHGLSPYEELFKKYNISFQAASGRKQGVEMIREDRPKIIIIDFATDSIETSRLFKDFPDIKAIPILYIAPRDRVDDIALALTIPVNDYLFFPFNEEEFHMRVQALIAFAGISIKDQMLSVNEKIDELKKLVELFSGYSAARLELAQLYANNGQPNESFQEYLKLIQFYFDQDNLGEAYNILTKLQKTLRQSGGKKEETYMDGEALTDPQIEKSRECSVDNSFGELARRLDGVPLDSLKDALQRPAHVIEFWSKIIDKKRFGDFIEDCLSILQS